MMDKFKMTDMRDVSLVLGMQVKRDRKNKTRTVRQENSTFFSGEVWHGELQAYQYSRPRIGALHPTARGYSSKRGGDATVPSQYGLGDALLSNHNVRHHVEHLPTCSCYVVAFESAHGRGQAPAIIPG